jgi:hypothetical protein
MLLPLSCCVWCVHHTDNLNICKAGGWLVSTSVRKGGSFWTTPTPIEHLRKYIEIGETSMVWLNICDDKHGLAEYL